LTVVREISHHLHAKVPLGFRLLLREWVPGGIQLKEAIAFARLLEQAGISYLSGAAANFNSIFSSSVMQKMDQLAYLRDDMVQITNNVTIPTIISGRITTPSLANELLEQGAADLIGLGRPLRVDTGWVIKTQKATSSIKLCVNCNWCLKSVILEKGFVCRRWPKTAQLKTHFERMLLTRNNAELWVVADEEDPAQFKKAIPDLLSFNKNSKWDHPVTIFFPVSFSHVDSLAEAGMLFINWMKQRANNVEMVIQPQPLTEKKVHNSLDKRIREALGRQNQGLVLIGRKESQPWRERLLYTLRHRVVGLVNANPRLKDVVVFLDFSDASMLAVAFVQRVFVNRPALKLCFVHALEGRKAEADRHWSRLRKVVGLHQNEKLRCLPERENPTDSILEEIERGRYGTIVMGKRGLTGIKRLLLGSVSRAVLRKLNDQTLFLVD
jgi:nucleotide-binding universal stress UspA family protein